MSGNLWMFSDMLDDEDIEMLKHEFITYYQGADYYGLGLKVFTRIFENETVVAIPLDEAWQHDLYIGGNYGI